MRKIAFIVLVLFLGSSTLLHCQTILKNSSDINGYKNLPNEGIFLHYNASLLFAGEHLYYKVYCLSRATNNLSSLSKIAYVELVGEDQQPVFRHKIKLTSGLGQGDFFIPTTVPSGNYKLIGYTKWMKNDVENNFFQDDIGIINPYQENQEAIEAEDVESSILDPKDSISEIVVRVQKVYSLPKDYNSEFLDINLKNNSFGKREKVSFTLNSLLESSEQGSYSISVRKIDSIDFPNRVTATIFKPLFVKNSSKELPVAINENVQLPELRGEIISGKVISKKTNLPLAGEKVAISIPGKEYIFDIAYANGNGIFYFNLDQDYNTTNAIVQVISENKEENYVNIDMHQSVDYKNLVFNKLLIAREMNEIIVNRSIYNQIENAYNDVKPDTFKPLRSVIPFYRDFDETYNLDDYTRFRTIKETMVEIIDHVWVKNTKTGEPVFQVRGHDPFIDTGLPSLVTIDGAFLQHHSDFIDYNAKKVKSISLLRDKYRIGPQIFQGIIAIETIHGDFRKTQDQDYINNIELFKPLVEKNYFHQKYNEDTSNNTNRIPDYRQQLLWIPDLRLNGKNMTLEFFTSDNIGNYEICLEGFTNNGNPVSIRKVIQIK